MATFTFNDAHFYSALLEGIAWGSYCVIFTNYLKVSGGRSQSILRYPLILLFVLCTIFIVLDDAASYVGLFGNNTHDDDVLATLSIALSAMYSFADFVSQGILIYRCWVMWNKRWWVIALPLLASVTAFTIGILLVAGLKIIGNGNPPVWFFPLGTSAFALSLATNAAVTSALVWQLWVTYKDVRKGLPDELAHDVRPAMSMLIESGMLTFLGQLVWVVLFGIQNPAFNLVDGPITQLYGITPTLVIVRVASGSSYENTKAKMTSSMHFRPGATSHAVSGGHISEFDGPASLATTDTKGKVSGTSLIDMDIVESDRSLSEVLIGKYA